MGVVLLSWWSRSDYRVRIDSLFCGRLGCSFDHWNSGGALRLRSIFILAQFLESVEYACVFEKVQLLPDYLVIQKVEVRSKLHLALFFLTVDELVNLLPETVCGATGPPCFDHCL